MKTPHDHRPVIFIYGLVDPRTNALRSIGKSHDPWNRRADHLIPSALAKRSSVARWLRGLVSHGLRPHLIILETTGSDGWQEAERRHIADARARGCRLTNIRPGGDGAAVGKKQGPKPHTPDHRAKLSAANRGKRLPPEQVAKIAAAGKGRRHSAETKARMRANNAGKTLSAETRAKIGAARRGKEFPRSPETHAKIVAHLPRGDAHWAAKLTEADVPAIRACFAAGGVSKAALARQYGVSDSTIGRVIRGEMGSPISATSLSEQHRARALSTARGVARPAPGG